MFLSKLPENIDDEFKITLLSLLINFKYDDASAISPLFCQNQVGFDKQNSQLCVYMSSPFRGFVTTKNSS